jgi:hypothetical protein
MRYEKKGRGKTPAPYILFLIVFLKNPDIPSIIIEY